MWGCGVFGNDLDCMVKDFRYVLEEDFRGVFSDIVFVIMDWLLERRFLGFFCDVFVVIRN